MLKIQKVTTVAQVKEMLDNDFSLYDMATHPKYFKNVDDKMFQYRLSQAVKALTNFEDSTHDLRIFRESMLVNDLEKAARRYLAAMKELEEYILSAQLKKYPVI